MIHKLEYFNWTLGRLKTSEKLFHRLSSSTPDLLLSCFVQRLPTGCPPLPLPQIALLESLLNATNLGREESQLHNEICDDEIAPIALVYVDFIPSEKFYSDSVSRPPPHFSSDGLLGAASIPNLSHHCEDPPLNLVRARVEMDHAQLFSLSTLLIASLSNLVLNASRIWDHVHPV